MVVGIDHTQEVCRSSSAPWPPRTPWSAGRTDPTGSSPYPTSQAKCTSRGPYLSHHPRPASHTDCGSSVAGATSVMMMFVRVSCAAHTVERAACPSRAAEAGHAFHDVQLPLRHGARRTTPVGQPQGRLHPCHRRAEAWCARATSSAGTPACAGVYETDGLTPLSMRASYLDFFGVQEPLHHQVQDIRAGLPWCDYIPGLLRSRVGLTEPTLLLCTGTRVWGRAGTTVARRASTRRSSISPPSIVARRGTYSPCTCRGTNVCLVSCSSLFSGQFWLSQTPHAPGSKSWDTACTHESRPVLRTWCS
jgi:hypothetical protein